jgi:phospholipase C
LNISPHKWIFFQYPGILESKDGDKKAGFDRTTGKENDLHGRPVLVNFEINFCPDLMDTRRDFLKKAILLSGSAGLSSVIPPSIQRAMAIDPAEGSTFLDAEHVVILMQENRSFDHCFGTLRGVRGYNDPRAITLPDGNPVWLQSNKNGETYVPFRFDIKDTKITWMGSVPHSRQSQVDCNNGGKYDKWLESKRPGNQKYADMPLTLGYYNREDLPFHYSMAEAFTICDQNFSSAMTSTWPNRLFLWSGTVRGEDSGDVKAYMRNQIPYGEARWKTFPETLEENGIEWKVYQNEITSGRGFDSEDQEAWLANFGCNPLEFLSQFNVRFHPRYFKSLGRRMTTLEEEIAGLEKTVSSMTSASAGYDKSRNALERKREVLQETRQELEKWTADNYEKLSPFQKGIYEKAFTTNTEDPDFLQLTTLRYTDNGEDRELTIPKGDVLYQFRKDVDSGKLPTVSWIVPSENLSDHPTAPWYGALYTSEILDILTRNPEVWKKTIFIVTYDENDGYFDHVPPFIPPDPKNAGTGRCSPGVNMTTVEWVEEKQELRDGIPKAEARSGPVGLGYRVPMVVASPWSRGGKVCSEVFDHTSSLQFLEVLLSKKFNKTVYQPTLSTWRRAICGDLTSVFNSFENKKDKVDFVTREPFFKRIHSAQFKNEPSNFKKLTNEQIQQIRRDPVSAEVMPRQEPGMRTACALPYQLYAEGALSADKKYFQVNMRSRTDFFGKRSAGSPFKIYAPGNYRSANDGQYDNFEAARSWDYAVKGGDAVTGEWPLDAFEGERYNLRLYGPNGFYREFIGDVHDPLLEVACEYQLSRSSKTSASGNIELKVRNAGSATYTIVITDNAYGSTPVSRKMLKGESVVIALDLSKGFHWYDFTVTLSNHPTFSKRYAGKVETGKEGVSDPAMGEIA